MQPLARAQGHAGDIGTVTDDIGRLRKRRRHLGGDQIFRAGAEARDDKLPAHGRRPWPWITAVEK